MLLFYILSYLDFMYMYISFCIIYFSFRIAVGYSVSFTFHFRVQLLVYVKLFNVHNSFEYHTVLIYRIDSYILITGGSVLGQLEECHIDLQHHCQLLTCHLYT